LIPCGLEIFTLGVNGIEAAATLLYVAKVDNVKPCSKYLPDVEDILYRGIPMKAPDSKMVNKNLSRNGME
jgi:hypothetical protein